MSGGSRARNARPPAGLGPIVSVVTVVRNSAPTLGRAAESVFTQNYPNIEYIVVDGGSTDGSLEVIGRMDERIAVWVSGADSGISDAFNRGIALARGEIVGLLNSDDWYEPNVMEAVVDAMQKCNADIAYGKAAKWKGNHRMGFITSDASLLETEMTLCHPTVFVRRACYERFGLFRLDFHLAMDYEWLLRAKVGGARFCAVNKCIANMRGGGVGDRRWWRGQMEVARARALHLDDARGRVRYWRYLIWAISIGTFRRAYQALGFFRFRARGWLRRRLYADGSSHTSDGSRSQNIE
jgi:glycosyltransferase involved in cell wall biosynthesis